MEQRTSSTVVFVVLACIIYGEIKGSTQSVTQPCERNKRAISLCENSPDNSHAGFLTYNMSTSPEWCNCSLSIDQEDTMDVQYATTVLNATYDFVLHVARGGGGNIRGRDGHWNDSISKTMPWTVYLSKANLETERTAIQGLCFSYEVKNETTRFSILCRTSDMELGKYEPRNTSLIIWFLSGLACVLAFAAIVVVFIFHKPRCVVRDGRFSTKAQDEILTALQRTSNRGEEKDGEKDGQGDGLEKTTGECRLPLPDHTAQGACISSSKVIHDGGVAKESSAGGYHGTTREPGTRRNHIEPDDAQNGPSAGGDVGASDDDAETIQMVDNIVYETSSVQTGPSAESGVKTSDDDAEKIQMVDNIVYETCSVQTGPSAEGGVKTSDDDAEKIQMVDNIVYETCSVQTGPSAEGGVRTSDDDAEEIQMVDNIVYETCSGGGK